MHSLKSNEGQIMKALVFLLIAVPAVRLAAQGPRFGQVKTCSQISLARPGFGVPYRGTVRNDDYKLSLIVPGGLTGWGADPVAPFHGFTIFLPPDGNQSSCIMFEIHLRVNLGLRESRHRGARVMIGDVPGWKEEAAGTINGVEFTNVTIRFSVAQGHEVDDGAVWLVTPARDVDKNRPILEALLSRITLGRQ